jgi:toxin ParE1/3/4
VRVRWLRQSRQDLFAVREYIGRDSVAAAIRTIRKIRSVTSQLRRFPESGRLGRVSGTRELVVPGTPYVIVYRTSSAAIEVLSVLHAARIWPQEFFE